MTPEESFGLAVMLAFTASIGVLVAVGFRKQPGWRMPILLGLVAVVVGSQLRHFVLTEVYGGVGDAGPYFRWGLTYAEYFARLDFSPLFEPELWRSRGRWWGTNFVGYPSGFVLALIGPSFRGEFVAFALFAFLGKLLIAATFIRALPGLAWRRYLFAVCLLPSLWFWPSSIGKDALIMLGVGMAFYGWFGRRNLLLMGAGFFLIVSIRPHVGAILAFALVAGELLGRSVNRQVAAVRLAGLVLVGLVVVVTTANRFGLEGFDLEGAVEFVEDQRERSGRGGSGLEEAGGVGLGSLPMAFLNIWFRPFPWEAGSLVQVLSAVEMTLLWLLIGLYRSRVVQLLREWRAHPALTAAIVFVLAYSALMGLAMGNLGIIARQRVLIFPFFLLLLCYRKALPRPKARPIRDYYERPPPPAAPLLLPERASV